MNKRTWTTATLLTVLGAVLATPAVAQRGAGPRVRGMQARTGCAESALRLKEGLELNDEQVAQLEALRTSCVERQQSHRAQATEMRSQLRAGQITVEDFRSAMEQRRETAQAARDQTRTRLQEILTEAQMTELDRSVGQTARSARRGVLRRGGEGFRGRGQQGFRGRGRHGFRGRHSARRIHR